MEFNLGWNLVGVKLRRVKFGDKERKDRYIILFFIDFNLFLTSRRQIMPRKIIVFIKLIKNWLNWFRRYHGHQWKTSQKKFRAPKISAVLYILNWILALEATRNLTQIEFWIQFSQKIFENFEKNFTLEGHETKIKSHSCQIMIERFRFGRKKVEFWPFSKKSTKTSKNRIFKNPVFRIFEKSRVEIDYGIQKFDFGELFTWLFYNIFIL